MYIKSYKYNDKNNLLFFVYVCICNNEIYRKLYS